MTVADSKRLNLNFIFFSLGIILAIIFLSFYVESLPEEKAPMIFVSFLALIMLGGPAVFLLYYYLVLSEKVEIIFHKDGIDSNKGISFMYDEIKSTDSVMNRYGSSNLFIVKLYNGKKYSFSPSMRFGRTSNLSFNQFVAIIEKKVKAIR